MKYVDSVFMILTAMQSQQCFCVTNNATASITTHVDVHKIGRSVLQLGGINVYQHLSVAGGKRHGNFNTSQWVVRKLKDDNILPPQVKFRTNELRTNHSFAQTFLAQSQSILFLQESKITLLDVGALDLNYEKYSNWILCTAIDLNPQRREILKADFLKFQVKFPLHSLTFLSFCITDTKT